MNLKSMDYQAFLQSKTKYIESVGFKIKSLNKYLFDWQAEITQWALWRGRAALFEACGLGKTLQQLDWAFQIHKKTKKPILILTPLAVSYQTKREAEKFEIDCPVKICQNTDDVINGINITNYEKLHHFESSSFVGIVLDESSILKAFSGKIRKQITDFAKQILYRLACTATPAPNDYMELGTHSEFLDVMSRNEMLAKYFKHDSGETSKWRIKHHAQDIFWKWITSWSIAIQQPTDLGYDNNGFNLPPLNIEYHGVKSKPLPGCLFVMEAQTLQERRQAKRDSINDRVALCAELAIATDRPFLVWCNLNAESDALKKAIPGAVEIKGSNSVEHKEKSMIGFSDGSIRVLVTKPSIAGFGMNWQHCSDMAFVGLSDSYEQYHQAVRRCWRFGQERTVNAHIIAAEAEGAILTNIARKKKQASDMFASLIENMACRKLKIEEDDSCQYQPQKKISLPVWI